MTRSLESVETSMSHLSYPPFKISHPQLINKGKMGTIPRPYRSSTGRGEWNLLSSFMEALERRCIRSYKSQRCVQGGTESEMVLLYWAEKKGGSKTQVTYHRSRLGVSAPVMNN